MIQFNELEHVAIVLQDQLIGFVMQWQQNDFVIKTTFDEGWSKSFTEFDSAVQHLKESFKTNKWQTIKGNEYEGKKWFCE